MANSTLRGFFPTIAYQLVPGTSYNTALQLIQVELRPDQTPAEEIAATGRAYLELADVRWLRMTGSPPAQGGSNYLLSRFHRRQGTRRIPAAARRSRPNPANAAKSPLPGQYARPFTSCARR